MELAIGATIRQLRKNIGMGQEELADTVGVSVPAVSKWECGKAYPDITLLPIIAKTLCTNVDTLLSYPAALSEDEIDNLTTSCSETFDKEGFEKGYSMLSKLLSEHPDDILLKCNLGTVLSMYSGKFPDGERSKYLEKSIELCKPAANSSNPTWKSMAQKMLTNLYIMNEQFDLAEALLQEYLGKEEAATDQTLAVIHFRKGEYEKAEKIYQRSLFKSISECETALSGLAAIASKNENESLFIDIQEKTLALSKLFEIESFPGKCLNPYISLCCYYGKKEMSNEMLAALEGLANSLDTWNSPCDFSKLKLFNQMQPAYGISFGATMHDAILQLTSEFKSYSFIKNNPEFKRIIDRIENISLDSK